MCNVCVWGEVMLSVLCAWCVCVVCGVQHVGCVWCGVHDVCVGWVLHVVYGGVVHVWDGL